MISDRYDASSLAYQSVSSGGAAEEAVEWIRSLNRYVRRPDLTIVLDVSPETASERRLHRGEPAQLYEQNEVQRALAAFYKDLARAHAEGSRRRHRRRRLGRRSARPRLGGVRARVRRRSERAWARRSSPRREQARHPKTCAPAGVSRGNFSVMRTRAPSLLPCVRSPLVVAACAAAAQARRRPVCRRPPPAPAPAGPGRPVDCGPARSRRRALGVHAVVSEGLGMFLRRVDVDDQPVFVGGKFHGFRIAGLRDPQFWSGVDLKPGDVVTSVNGFPIEHPEQAQTAFESLEVASELRVAVRARRSAPRAGLPHRRRAVTGSGRGRRLRSRRSRAAERVADGDPDVGRPELDAAGRGFAVLPRHARVRPRGSAGISAPTKGRSETCGPRRMSTPASRFVQ